MGEALVHDVRAAGRQLRRAPGFATAAIATLALGIGLNATVFSVLNALALRPLAIADPDGLIGVSGRSAHEQLRLTPIPAVGELSTADGPLQPVCGYNGGGVLAIDVDGAATQGVFAFVTGQCFATFGIQPYLGRLIGDDDAPLMSRGKAVAVIGHRFWIRMFGSDPGVIGKVLRMEGEVLTVIGVLPPGFDGLQVDTGVDVYAPFDTVLPQRTDRRPGASHLLGRLRPGRSFAQAVTELTTRWPALLDAVVPATLAAAERDDLRAAHPRIERLGTGQSTYRDLYARPLVLILSLTGLLLVLACANLGGLLLARLASRGPEVAVRLALGGSRWRVGRLIVIEGLALSLAGTALALPFSFAIVGPLASLLPVGLVERTVSITPDLHVLAWTGLAGIVAGVLMTAAPLWVVTRTVTASDVSGRRTVGGAASRWARALMVAQVALSVVLLAAAGILTRSLYLLERQPLGLRPDGVVVVRVMPRPNAYRDLDNERYYPLLLERMAALPGVRAVGYSRLFPRLFMEVPGQPIAIVGAPPGELRATLEAASPGFFDAVGIPLLTGRLPTWSDTERTLQVGVASARLAAMLAPGGDVIGRRVRVGSGPADQDVAIVGVVGNATMGNPRQAAMPVLYRPALQTGRFGNYPSVAIAVDGDAEPILAGVRQALAQGGREYAHSVDRLSDLLTRAPASERMSASLGVAIAALAALLAGVGLHSLLAYAVSRRTREFGLRLAVGARPEQVGRIVIASGAKVVLAGLVFGLPLAWLAAGALRALTFGVTPLDPLTFGGVVVLVASLALIAGIAPARRAASVDPAVSLRAE